MAKVTIIPSKINPITQLPHNSLNKRKVAAYARVSTLQDEQVSSYDAQVDYYKSILLKGKIGSTLISTQIKASQEQIEKIEQGLIK